MEYTIVRVHFQMTNLMKNVSAKEIHSLASSSTLSTNNNNNTPFHAQDACFSSWALYQGYISVTSSTFIKLVLKFQSLLCSALFSTYWWFIAYGVYIIILTSIELHKEILLISSVSALWWCLVREGNWDLHQGK